MRALRRLDLNLLLIFEALLSERHVTRAAEKVHLSQSAMSHALNRLREQLDDPILVRTERGMQPTARALAMLPAVREALQLLERTLALPEPFDPACSERTFVLAATDYFEAVVLPEVMGFLQRVAPAIRIEVELIDQHGSEARLASQAVDLVVGLDATHKPLAHLLCEPWLDEASVCLVGQNNYRVAGELALDTYLDLPHVACVDRHGALTTGVDSWLAEQGLARRILCQNLNYTAAARIVAKSEAVLTLPRQMALLFCQMLPVRLVNPPAGIPPVAMSLISHPLYADTPAIRWLREQVQTFGRKVVEGEMLD
ncbi:MAG TPA: LysR family transcriptional regulator [Motiliproteus sp.]